MERIVEDKKIIQCQICKKMKYDVAKFKTRASIKRIEFFDVCPECKTDLLWTQACLRLGGRTYCEEE